ncbi:MAG TPA: TolC family protein [Fimbriimonadaceae bacterium]|nr:TolC family protein [Fimbriimonadaceae bacterium]
MSPFLALCGLFAPSQDLAPGATITLDQALAYADRNAFAILIQQTRVEKQRQDVLAKTGQLGPTLYLNGNYTRFDRPTTATFSGNTVTIVPIQQSYGEASATMPIDISGNMHRLMRASKASQFAQEETLLAQRADIRRDVTSAYYGVLRARSQVLVAQEALASDVERTRNVEQRFKAGVVAQVDVLRAQTQQAQSESNLIAATTGLELAKQSLNNVLARPIESTFDVADVPAANPPAPDAAKLSEEAQRSRHEARALAETARALTEVRKYVQHANEPTLNLGLNYTGNVKPLGFGQRPEVGTGVLSLNWPILDSGYYRAEVRAARQDEEQAQLQLKQVRLQISLEVRQAATSLVNAEQRLKVADRQVETARVALRQTMLRHEQGVAILLEVIEAQRDLTSAEFAQVSAKYDVLQALADLQRAAGASLFNTLRAPNTLE